MVFVVIIAEVSWIVIRVFWDLVVVFSLVEKY